MAERALTTEETALLLHVTDVRWPRAAELHASVPFLVVTGGCGCGCASFDIRDTRFPEQRHELEHWCNAVTSDNSAGVAVWLGSEGRLISVDVEPEDGGLPAAETLEVRLPGT